MQDYSLLVGVWCLIFKMLYIQSIRLFLLGDFILKGNCCRDRKGIKGWEKAFVVQSECLLNVFF